MSELTPRFDKESRLPMYEQLYRHIAAEILQGRLSGGTQLPSRRVLSRHLKISEQTVSAAYDLLKAEGFLRAKERSGLFVEDIRPLGQAPLPSQIKVSQAAPQPRFDFSPQSTDTSLFPYRTWAKLVRETLLDEPGLMNRGDPRGEDSLRLALAGFLHQFRGVRSQADNIIVSSGVDALLSTIGALFKGSLRVGIEDPGYPEAARALARCGHQCVPVPLDGQGVRMDMVRRENLDLLYLTPAHQFPTGTSMPAGRRAELLYWAVEGKGRYLIEDDYDSEFRYTTRPLPALQGMDTRGRVIYLSTFSRSLAPGLRIAYMVLPDDLNTLYGDNRLRAGEAVSRFEQYAMARLLAEGHYTRHLRRANAVYQQRNRVLCALLGGIPGSFLSGQDAGLHFLFGVEGQAEHRLIQSAGESGIPLTGLSAYSLRYKTPPALVLGFGGLDDHTLQDAVAGLRDAWKL